MTYDCADMNPVYASHLGLEFDYNIISTIENRLKEAEYTTLPLDEGIYLLHELASFELGRFLLQNKGLDGYWTQYIILGDHSSVRESSIEHWILYNAPAVLATRERFGIFQQKNQEFLQSNTTLASVPSGLMDDLFSLNYEGKSHIKLTGIDLDPRAISQAQRNHNLPDFKVEFKLQDAWNLSAHEEYNLITSNGLNIYEPNDERVIALYSEFYNALISGGRLVTSFLTPPPTLSNDSSWRNFSLEDVIKQKALFSDILQVKWQVFRTEAQMRNHLEQVGFKILEVIYDKQGMFPTIIAQK